MLPIRPRSGHGGPSSPLSKAEKTHSARLRPALRPPYNPALIRAILGAAKLDGADPEKVYEAAAEIARHFESEPPPPWEEIAPSTSASSPTASSSPIPPEAP